MFIGFIRKRMLLNMSMCVSSKYTSIYSEQIYACFHCKMEKDEYCV